MFLFYCNFFSLFILKIYHFLQSVLPGILQGDKSDSLLYGSVDNGKKICWNEDFHSKVRGILSWCHLCKFFTLLRNLVGLLMVMDFVFKLERTSMWRNDCNLIVNSLLFIFYFVYFMVIYLNFLFLLWQEAVYLDL